MVQTLQYTRRSPRQPSSPTNTQHPHSHNHGSYGSHGSNSNSTGTRSRFCNRPLRCSRQPLLQFFHLPNRTRGGGNRHFSVSKTILDMQLLFKQHSRNGAAAIVSDCYWRGGTSRNIVHMAAMVPTTKRDPPKIFVNEQTEGPRVDCHSTEKNVN